MIEAEVACRDNPTKIIDQKKKKKPTKIIKIKIKNLAETANPTRTSGR